MCRVAANAAQPGCNRWGQRLCSCIVSRDKHESNTSSNALLAALKLCSKQTDGYAEIAGLGQHCMSVIVETRNLIATAVAHLVCHSHGAVVRAAAASGTVHGISSTVMGWLHTAAVNVMMWDHPISACHASETRTQPVVLQFCPPCTAHAAGLAAEQQSLGAAINSEVLAEKERTIVELRETNEVGNWCAGCAGCA